MRISVIGNSDTTGMLLQPGEKTWPTLLQERLGESLGEPVVVDNWRFVPYRPGAVERALGLVTEAQPDFVILTLASFWCAFGTVRARVERRFGRRAARFYTRAEQAFSRSVERGGRTGQSANAIGRRTARRIIGTSTPMSVDQFIEVYSTLIRTLSQREQLQVLVLGDHHYTAWVRRAMPAIEPAIARIQAAIQPIVVERKLRWGDLEAALSAGGRREEMITWDGVHMTAEAHERGAAALLPTLVEFATHA